MGNPPYMQIVKNRTPWEFLEAYPPPYCRLLAKKNGGGTGDMAITDAEVAIASGIPLQRIHEISRLASWDGVPAGEMRRFFAACNFDPTNSAHRARVNQYNSVCTKRNTVPFRYLRRSPKWETEFLPLYLMVRKIMQSRGESSPQTVASITHARS